MAAIPKNVKLAFDKMDKQQQKAFRREFNKRAKYVGTGYLAWLLLGWHYLYVHRVGFQFAFWLTGGFLVVGWLLDFFRIPSIIGKCNEDIARELMVAHKSMM